MRKTESQDMEDRIAELLERPYTKIIRGDTDEGFLAFVAELPGCITAGETEHEALDLLRDAMGGWFEVALLRGLVIPEPSQEPAPPRLAHGI